MLNEYEVAVMNTIEGLKDDEAIKKIEDIEFNIEMKDRWSMADYKRMDACSWIKNQIKEGKKNDIR